MVTLIFVDEGLTDEGFERRLQWAAGKPMALNGIRTDEKKHDQKARRECSVRLWMVKLCRGYVEPLPEIRC